MVPDVIDETAKDIQLVAVVDDSNLIFSAIVGGDYEIVSVDKTSGEGVWNGHGTGKSIKCNQVGNDILACAASKSVWADSVMFIDVRTGELKWSMPSDFIDLPQGEQLSDRVSLLCDAVLVEEQEGGLSGPPEGSVYDYSGKQLATNTTLLFANPYLSPGIKNGGHPCVSWADYKPISEKGDRIVRPSTMDANGKAVTGWSRGDDKWMFVKTSAEIPGGLVHEIVAVNADGSMLFLRESFAFDEPVELVDVNGNIVHRLQVPVPPFPMFSQGLIFWHDNSLPATPPERANYTSVLLMPS